jgi:hypothetical protein
MPQQSNGLMRGFQLWINLPAAEKMSDPAYQEFAPGAIPEVAGEGVRVRVMAGEYSGQRGVIDDPHTDLLYLDVTLAANACFSVPLVSAYIAFTYVYEGGAVIGQNALPQHSLNVLSQGDEVDMCAGPAGARFILVAGRSIGEPAVQYGPFVMNTREEIEQAMRDYRDGKLVRAKAAMNAVI